MNAFLEMADDDTTKSLFQVLQIARDGLAVEWQSSLTQLRASSSEASSVIKHLSAVERYFKPFYSSDPVAAVAATPPLLDTLVLLHDVVPFYHDLSHITVLAAETTNQIIVCCKAAIRLGGRVWDQADTIPQPRSHHWRL